MAFPIPAADVLLPFAGGHGFVFLLGSLSVDRKSHLGDALIIKTSTIPLASVLDQVHLRFEEIREIP